MKRVRFIDFALTAILLLVFASGCSILHKSVNTSVTAKEYIGITLIAKEDLVNIDQFMAFGSYRAPQNATCEFVANSLYTSQYGITLKKGDSFVIGNATILEHTDGLGNSGTKLILESADPKKGLTLYCYAIDPSKKQFWALDKDTVLKILNEMFEIEE